MLLETRFLVPFQRSRASPSGQIKLKSSYSLLIPPPIKMTRKISLELPDDLSQRLEAKAQVINISLEAMILNSLEELATQPDDPLAALIGTLSAEHTDIASRHDDYIGQAINSQELPGEQ